MNDTLNKQQPTSKQQSFYSDWHKRQTATTQQSGYPTNYHKTYLTTKYFFS